ncbi:hypothetical protein LptCag_1260 [Leptospirillum ferriphilum]|uniref:Lipoprotein n=2 Tax=Leptospirillum TaxID=179 RepID=A0A094W5Y6_9BACT|nr:hypothetical protein LptCag_1260 [Leptospirillum ferriphilum]
MMNKNVCPKFMTVLGVLVFVFFFSACTKSNTDNSHSAISKDTPKSGSGSLLQKKAKDGFVPYENRPPFGTPVETH